MPRLNVSTGLCVPVVVVSSGTSSLPGGFDIDLERPLTGDVRATSADNQGGPANDPDPLQVNAAGPILTNGSLASGTGDTLVLSDFSGTFGADAFGKVGDVVLIESGPDAGLYVIAEITGFNTVRVTDRNGGSVTFGGTSPAPWTIKRASALLEEAQDDGEPAASSDVFTALDGANFGGVDPFQLTSGEVGDLLVVEDGPNEGTYLIVEVLNADQVRVADLCGDPADFTGQSGPAAWRTEHAVPLETTGLLTLSDGVAVTLGPLVDRANVRIESTDGAVDIVDATIDLDGRDDLAFPVDGGKLVVRALQSVRIAQSLLSCAGNRPTVGSGGEGGRIGVAFGTEAIVGGTAVVVADGGRSMTNEGAGDGGTICIGDRPGASAPRVVVGTDAQLRANGGSHFVDEGGPGGAGGDVFVRLDGFASSVHVQGRLLADGGSAGDASGGPGGAVVVIGERIVVTKAEGDPVLDASGGSSSTSGGFGARGGNGGTVSLDSDGPVAVGTPGSGDDPVETGCPALLALGGGGDEEGGAGGSVPVLADDVVTIDGFLSAQGGYSRNMGAAGAGGGDEAALGGTDIAVLDQDAVVAPSTGLLPLGVSVVKITNGEVDATQSEFAVVVAGDPFVGTLPEIGRGLGGSTPITGTGLFLTPVRGVQVLANGTVVVESTATLLASGGSPLLAQAESESGTTATAGGDGGTVRLHADEDGVGESRVQRGGALAIAGRLLAGGGFGVNAPAGDARRPDGEAIAVAVELAGEGDNRVEGFVDASGGQDPADRHQSPTPATSAASSSSRPPVATRIKTSPGRSRRQMHGAPSKRTRSGFRCTVATRMSRGVFARARSRSTSRIRRIVLPDSSTSSTISSPSSRQTTSITCSSPLTVTSPCSRTPV